MDGTGKTYHAMELCKTLADRHIPCMYIHMMSQDFDYTIIRFLLSPMRKARLSGVGVHEQTNVQVKSNSIVKVVWPLIALMDHIVTYFVRIRPLAKHSVVVCDRYFYDYLASFCALGLVAPGIFTLYLKCIPRPKQTFFLDATIDAAFDRKKDELSLEYLKQQRKAYLMIAQTLKPQPKVIDATRDRLAVSSDILEEIQAFLPKFMPHGESCG